MFGLLAAFVSVHFDFARRSVRAVEATQLVRALETHENPLMILGDFNCGWSDQQDALRIVAHGLKLQSYSGHGSTVATHPRTGKHIDWILISPELRFVSYRVLRGRTAVLVDELDGPTASSDLLRHE